MKPYTSFANFTSPVGSDFEAKLPLHGWYKTDNSERQIIQPAIADSFAF
jgi:hypothetical protein